MDNRIGDKFKKMGVRAQVIVDPDASFGIDVLRDRNGEYFQVRHGTDVHVTVLDVRPKDRHLLLMARSGMNRSGQIKSKFLCGHDERHWFVAAVPENQPARDVESAKDALKPAEVWDAMRQFGVPMSERNSRKTDGFIRQGEWFFLPRPWLKVNLGFILRNEPIRRGRGKPHICQELYRKGGERVWVCDRYPNGLNAQEYAALAEDERKKLPWRVMVRDPRAFVRGSVRHPDHKTIHLPYWHQVVMNTETQSRAMSQVAFLD